MDYPTGILEIIVSSKGPHARTIYSRSVSNGVQARQVGAMSRRFLVIHHEMHAVEAVDRLERVLC